MCIRTPGDAKESVERNLRQTTDAEEVMERVEYSNAEQCLDLIWLFLF